MKRVYIIIILFLLVRNTGLGQISEGGVPYSFNELQTFNCGFFNHQERLRNDEQFAVDEPVIGDAFKLNLSFFENAAMTESPNGDQIWKLQINVSDGEYIMLVFDELYLPSNTKLFIYSEDKNQVIGAFTDKNNTPSQKMTTSPIRGRSIVIEYFQPRTISEKTKLNIASLGLLNGLYSEYSVRGFGDSECMLNAKCSQFDGFCNQRRSVAMIIRVSQEDGAIRHCTGSLLENERRDGKPLFLTACHCIDTDNDYSISTAERNELQNWLFIFNYQSPDCNDPSYEPSMVHSISGATYINSSSPTHTDYALLQLNNRPPKDYNAFYNGWNNDADDMTYVAHCIHHPRGDIKKFSSGHKGTLIANAINLWRINWYSGSVQPVSSGAPLYSSDGYVVGQLSKAEYKCNAGLGLFGKFSRSWHNYSLSWALNPNGTHLGSSLYYISAMSGSETCRQDWYFPNGNDLHTSSNVSFLNPSSIGTRMYDGVYNAQNSIIAEAVAIQSGTSVVFEAGNYVELKPGFSTMNSSMFEAKIGDCLRGCGNEYFLVNNDIVDRDSSIMEISTTNNNVNYNNNIVPLDENLSHSVEVFPNPSSGAFNIILPTEKSEIAYLQIFNQIGDVVFATNFSNNSEIRVENLPSGLYLLSVFLSDRIITKRILIFN